MTSSVYQASEAQMASAGAPRPGVGLSGAVSTSAVCTWLIGTRSTKATRMFVDVPNHRTRRLWEPSQ